MSILYASGFIQKRPADAPNPYSERQHHGYVRAAPHAAVVQHLTVRGYRVSVECRRTSIIISTTATFHTHMRMHGVCFVQSRVRPRATFTRPFTANGRIDRGVDSQSS